MVTPGKIHKRLLREPVNLPFAPAAAARAFGLPRSGNHAIIDWILRNVDHRPSVFCNNCVPGRDPFAAFTQIEVNGKGRTGRVNRLGDAGIAREITAPPFLMVSYEGWNADLNGVLDDISQGFLSADFDFQVLIYRSFLNWLASTLALRRRQAVDRKSDASVAIRRSGDAVDAYPGMLRVVRAGGALTPVLYDRWFAEPAYREAVLDRLGLTVRDNSLGQESRMGGGSSFETGAADVTRLQVTDRWRQMLDEDAEYRALVARAGRMEGFAEELGQVFPEDAEILIRTARTAA